MARRLSSADTAVEEKIPADAGSGWTDESAYSLKTLSISDERKSQDEETAETGGLERDSEEQQQQQEQQPQQPPPHKYASGLELFLVLAPMTLAYFLVMLDGSIVSTAIPQITSEFKSLLDVGWYGSAYQLASSAFQPLSGKIYTYFKTKWAFLTFFAIFEIGSAICGAAQSSDMLIVGRAIAGLGSSGLMTGALTIISMTVPPQNQPLVMGVIVSLGQIGLACGPILGGAFTEYVSWRWCFYINLPVGAVVALLLLFLRIPEFKPKPPVRQVLGTAVKSLDLPGFVLVASAATMFLLGLEYGGSRFAWNSTTVIGLLLGAAFVFTFFLIWEWHQGNGAMLPFSMLRQRVIWSASATMFFFMGVLFCFNFYLPIYFQAVKGNSALMSGVHILPAIISQVVFATISGALVKSLGYYLPWVLSGTALTTVAYGLFTLLSPSTPVQDWVGFEILIGIGCGSAVTQSYIAIQNSVPPMKIPISIAILIFCQNLGGAVSLTAAQSIFGNSLRRLIAQDAPGVNPQRIIEAGARAFRPLVSQEQLPGVLQAYSSSIDRVMYLGIGLGAASFVFAWGLGWKNIKVKKTRIESVSETEDPLKTAD